MGEMRLGEGCKDQSLSQHAPPRPRTETKVNKGKQRAHCGHETEVNNLALELSEPTPLLRKHK